MGFTMHAVLAIRHGSCTWKEKKKNVLTFVNEKLQVSLLRCHLISASLIANGMEGCLVLPNFKTISLVLLVG